MKTTEATNQPLTEASASILSESVLLLEIGSAAGAATQSKYCGAPTLAIADTVVKKGLKKKEAAIFFVN